MFASPVQQYKAFPASIHMNVDSLNYRDQLCFTPDFQINSANNGNRLIREHEKHYKFVSEALLKTFPTEILVRRYREWCENNIEDRLKKIRLSDMIEQDSSINNEDQRVIDYVYQRDYDTLTKIAAIVVFYFPVHSGNLNAIKSKIKSIVNTLYFAGYVFVQNVAYKTKFKDIDVVEVTFEARYTDFKPKLANVLYHVTPASMLRKIKTNGLVPRSQNQIFSYPERVYLFNNIDMLLILDYAMEKTDAYVQQTQFNRIKAQFALLKLKSAKLESSRHFQDGTLLFYADSKYPSFDIHFPQAIYTYNSIPSKLIEDEAVLFDFDASTKTLLKKQKISLSSI